MASMFVSPQNSCFEILTPNDDGGTSALPSPLPHMRTQREGAGHGWEGLPQKVAMWRLDLGLTACRTVSDKCVLFLSLLVCGILLQQPEQTEIGEQQRRALGGPVGIGATLREPAGPTED